MKSSFDNMGDLYDLMVPWESRLSREKPFFQKLFEAPPKRVLDAACGTGRHALMFHSMGHRVWGADISLSAIAHAGKISSEAGPGINFIAGDLFAPSFRENVFDVVTVLGNSLAQFAGDEEMHRIFQGISGLLVPGGLCIFQIVNFHSSQVRGERFSPLRTAEKEGRDLLFQKFFDFNEESVTLNLLIFREEEKGWSRQLETARLRPWKKEELDAVLEKAGFAARDWYGDFHFSPFEPAASKDIIGVAKR